MVRKTKESDNVPPAVKKTHWTVKIHLNLLEFEMHIFHIRNGGCISGQPTKAILEIKRYLQWGEKVKTIQYLC